MIGGSQRLTSASLVTESLLTDPRAVNMHPIKAFGLGTAKSGTHSLCEIFRPRYRSEHEPHWQRLLPLIVGKAGGLSSSDEARGFVTNGDNQSTLQMNSSQLNYYLLPTILRHCPNALFILTIRDCVSWLESLLHHITTRPLDPTSPWIPFRELRFGRCEGHPAEERALAEAGFARLGGYLEYWSRHNSAVMSLVPPKRLLIIRTDHLSESVGDIADFVSIPRASLNAAAAHAFASHRQPGSWLSKVDREYLRRKVYLHCAPIMTSVFGDILHDL
jgi:hypothetical protein